MVLRYLTDVIRNIYNSGDDGKALLYGMVSGLGLGMFFGGRKLREIGEITGKYPFHTYIKWGIDVSPLGSFLMGIGIPIAIIAGIIAGRYLYKYLKS